MTIKEDRDDFNQSGLLGIIRKLRIEGRSGFILLEKGNWRGKLVPDRPSLISGQYLEVRPGNPAMLFRNLNDAKEIPTEFPERV